MLGWDNRHNRLEQSIQRIFLHFTNHFRIVFQQNNQVATQIKRKHEKNIKGYGENTTLLVSIHQLWDADICHSSDTRSGKHHNTITALFTPDISCYVVKDGQEVKRSWAKSIWYLRTLYKIQNAESKPSVGNLILQQELVF